VAKRSHPDNCDAQANGGNPGTTYGHCVCTAYPYNSVSGQCGSGDVTALPLSANTTDGSKNP